MYTGYSVLDGRIFGPRGDTRAVIKNGHICLYGEENPRFWINEGVIVSGEGPTEYWIENDFIYGPRETLPWLE